MEQQQLTAYQLDYFTTRVQDGVCPYGISEALCGTKTSKMLEIKRAD
ncbi:MAG: hypothetical protein M0Q41_05120 [Bacteroidales bacterium]|nr:hypothetical protein [Bacteroidales bacterium]